MKKVVLFLGIATAVAFASCGNKANNDAPAVETPVVEEVQIIEEVVVDSSTVEAAVVETPVVEEAPAAPAE